MWQSCWLSYWRTRSYSYSSLLSFINEKKTVYILHVGSDKLQVPSELHCLTSFPFNLYPVTHVYVALVWVPEVDNVIIPLDGSVSDGHKTENR